MRRCLPFIGAVLVAVASLLTRPSPATADNAPFWESPVGLTPGLPGNQVRMVAEAVDIQIRERPDGVYAVVDASFDMLNRGPDIRMKVGFPSSTLDVIGNVGVERGAGDEQPFSPVTFMSVNLDNFRVWTNDADYSVTKTKITTERYGSDWLLWEMPYPNNQPVTVHVSYEQLLGTLHQGSSDRGYVQPMYVLRTGALWDDTIGDAVVTISAPDGGGLIGGPEVFSTRTDSGDVLTLPSASEVIGADGASDVSSDRIVWHLRDFEPTRDVGTTYVIRDMWRPLREAERSIASAAATADDYRRATRLVGQLLGTEGPYGQSHALVKRYASSGRAWARQAATLAPDLAESWEDVGEVERWFAMPAHKHHGYLECWPTVGEDAYRRAIALGSVRAAERLENLFAASDFRETIDMPPTSACDGSTAPTLQVLALRRAIKGGNDTWALGVAPGGTAENFARYFAGSWLQMLTDEVNALRQRGMYRRASLQTLTFDSVAVTAPDAAVVETTEDWYDKTYRADNSMARDADGRLHQRYELRSRDGRWKVIDATLTRETPPKAY